MSWHRFVVLTLSLGATPAVAQTYGVSVSPHDTTVYRLPSNGTNYTAVFTVHDASTGIESVHYVLLTGSRLGGLTTVSMTGPGVSQTANPDSAEIASVPAGGTAVVTVTYSVEGGAEGSIDTLVFRARAIADPAAVDTGKLVVVRVKPSVSVVKSVSPTGTPVPGTDLTYTTTLTNAGSEDAASVVHIDSLPLQLGFKVGSVSTILPNGVTATITYSDNNGATWTYVPVSAGCGAPAGYDHCVRDIRTSLGSLNGNGVVEILFVGKIK
jgi:uncharacterized repeat protein (TIGR01451 family)